MSRIGYTDVHTMFIYSDEIADKVADDIDRIARRFCYEPMRYFYENHALFGIIQSLSSSKPIDWLKNGTIKINVKGTKYKDLTEGDKTY